MSSESELPSVATERKAGRGPLHLFLSAAVWYLRLVGMSVQGDEAGESGRRLPAGGPGPLPKPRLRPIAARVRRFLRTYAFAGLRGRRVLAVGACVVVALVAGSVGLRFALPYLSTPRFAAAPYFSLDAFRALRPGMTEDQARDLVGYPLQRVTIQGVASRWYFTAPASWEDRRCKICVAVFDGQGLLSSTREWWLHRALGGYTSMRHPWDDSMALEVGSLTLVAPDGTIRALDRQSGPCLVLCCPTGRKDDGDNTGLCLYSLDLERGQAHFEGAFAGTRPHLPENVYMSHFLYQDGMVTALPPCYASNHDDLSADVEWLIRRATGHAIAMPAAAPNVAISVPAP